MNLARLVHAGFWFDKSSFEHALELARRGVGGFCLYGGTREQIAHFTQAVREVSPLPYLLISADYEDGLGRWVPDAPLLPSNLALGAANDEQMAFEKGFITAQQARSLGVDWVFAPVLDLADNPLNPIVNTRSFGKEPEQVVRLAGAFLRGLKKGGALNSLKHFPGHGDTTTDSHLALPVLHKTAAQLREREMKPFADLLPLADSVMLGHLLVPEVDAEQPASLSFRFLQDELRERLHYNGCILTDALLMKAIGDEKQAALTALRGGADVLLVPEHPMALIDFLEQQPLSPEQLAHAFATQDTLCQQAQNMRVPSQDEAFVPTDFTRRCAQKAIVQIGNITLQPGETVYYTEVGNTNALPAEPFLQTLQNAGIDLHPYKGENGKLIVLCFRRYQAFQGAISLNQEDTQHLRRALEQATQSVCVLFASPWALQGINSPDSMIFTFSPAPDFQVTAAEILLGQRTPQGQLPVSL